MLSIKSILETCIQEISIGIFMKRKIWLLALILWIGLIFIISINKYIDIMEYFILYILIYLNIKNMNICGFKLLLNCLYISLFIAVVDETILSLVLINTYQVDNIIVNIVGAFVGFVVIYLYTKFIKRDNGVCKT